MKKPHWLSLKASVKVNHTQQTWILLRGEREGKKEDEWQSEEAERPIHSFQFPSSQTLEKKQDFLVN